MVDGEVVRPKGSALPKSFPLSGKHFWTPYLESRAPSPDVYVSYPAGRIPKFVAHLSSGILARAGRFPSGSYRLKS